MATEQTSNADVQFDLPGEGGIEVEGDKVTLGLMGYELTGTENAGQEDTPGDRGDAGKEGQEAASKDGTEAAADAPAADDDLASLQSPEAFNKEDPENVAAWVKEYHREDGTINMERFQKEVTANMKKEGGKAELNPATYDYLASLGFTKDDINTYIGDRLKALQVDATEAKTVLEKQDLEVFNTAQEYGSAFGASTSGPELLQAAIEWAKDGNYSDTQRAKYDKIMNGTDLEAKKEVVEVLLGRFCRSDTFKEGEKALKAAKLQERRSAPLRDATQGGTQRGGSHAESDTYPQGREGRAAWAADRKAAGDNNELLAKFQRKAARSGLI